MFYNFWKKNFCYSLALLLFFSAVCKTNNAYAIYDGPRTVKSYTQDRCDVAEISFTPFGGIDLDWQISNPVCASLVAGVGLVGAAASYAANNACANTIYNAETARQIAAGVAMSPTKIMEIAQNNATCAATSVSNPFCCATAWALVASTAATIAAMGVVYAAAKSAYDSTRVCGAAWSGWSKADGSAADSGSNSPLVKGKGGYRKCIETIFGPGGIPAECNSYGINSDSDLSRHMTNKLYREYFYGGMEYTDNGDDACTNPWDGPTRLIRLGYDSDNQKYYYTGAGNAPVYACNRFLLYKFATEDERAAAQNAYDCCVQRSQNTMCIDKGKDYKVCKLGSRCIVDAITFDIFPSKTVPNYICAKTYSVCPFNHNLGGGTETQNPDPNNPGYMTNSCQYMNHCIKLPIIPTIKQPAFAQAFVSSACANMEGDSQNVYSYNAGILTSNIRHFSAPVIQCFKETVENLFFNRAGHTICNDSSEIPLFDATADIVVTTTQNPCPHSGVKYKNGDTLTTPSFFSKIVSGLRTVIKVAMSISVMLFGAMILLGLQPVAKKQLLPYILKIGLVSYFALGTAWQDQFASGVIKSSSYLANMVFNLGDDGYYGSPSVNQNRLDGCQFPRFNYKDKNEDTRYNPATRAYPPGKEYLRPWDTLDCKLARAMGYGPSATVPNLIMLVVAGFFTGGLGIYFVVFSLILGFFMLSLVIRAIHIMLVAIIAITILIYVSPVTITLALFNRTKNVFDGWWRQVLGFCLQPMILFCYLAFVIIVFDKVVVGDVLFSGDGVKEEKTIDCTTPGADESIYCIMNIVNYKVSSVFRSLGFGIPILMVTMNKTKFMAILKGAFILFILSAFMDKITQFAQKLVGAGGPAPWAASMTKMMSSTGNFLRKAQRRAMRGTEKLAKKVGRYGSSKVQKYGNKGTSVADVGGREKSGVVVGSSGGKKGVMVGSASSSKGGTTVGSSNSSSGAVVGPASRSSSGSIVEPAGGSGGVRISGP